MSRTERRRSPRKVTHVLTSVRRLEKGEIKWSGFARTVNLSPNGVLFESPDPFKVGQELGLEFLLDDNIIVRVQGQVTRVDKAKGMNRIAADFMQMTTEANQLLARHLRHG